MEKFTVAIVRDHRNRTEADKEGPLEVRVTMNRKLSHINTGIRVRMNEWAGCVVNRPDADALNDRLGYIVQRCTAVITDMQRHGEAFDIKVVKDRVFCDETVSRTSLVDWIEQEYPKMNASSGTKRHYETVIRRLYDFKKLLSWNDLSVERIYEFDQWLHTLTTPRSNGLKQSGEEAAYIRDGSVWNYHKYLKAMINRAMKMGIVSSNPYDRLRGEFKRGIVENVEYLTEEEIAAIESLHPVEGSQVAMARDLLVFQIYTGLSYSDTQAFDIGQYKKVNGRWRANGLRMKTGVPYVCELLPQAVAVLEKYGMQAPNISNAQYNTSLKVIQSALGIRTRLHSHLGRHTFATRALSLGVPLQNVARMLGHTNVKQTQRYAKVLAESVHDDFDMMSKKLSKKKSEG